MQSQRRYSVGRASGECNRVLLYSLTGSSFYFHEGSYWLALRSRESSFSGFFAHRLRPCLTTTHFGLVFVPLKTRNCVYHAARRHCLRTMRYRRVAKHTLRPGSHLETLTVLRRLILRNLLALIWRWILRLLSVSNTSSDKRERRFCGAVLRKQSSLIWR